MLMLLLLVFVFTTIVFEDCNHLDVFSTFIARSSEKNVLNGTGSVSLSLHNDIDGRSDHIKAHAAGYGLRVGCKNYP